MARKKKKQVKGRSGTHKEFFAGGLSRKGHAIPPDTVYDRGKLEEDLEERQKEAAELDSDEHTIRAVIFDLGRVLISVDLSRGIFGYVTERLGGEGEQRMERLLDEPAFAEFSSGRMGPEDFHAALCERLELDLGYDEFIRLWCNIFDHVEEMEVIVGELVGRVILGCLSDTDQVHWKHVLEHFPILRHFDKPTLSFQTGAMKPKPEAYLAAAANVGVSPPECLFIDDLSRNVEGARRVGMQALQFQGAADLRRELIKRGLLEE